MAEAMVSNRRGDGPHLDLRVRVAQGAAVVGGNVGDAALAELHALHLHT